MESEAYQVNIGNNKRHLTIISLRRITEDGKNFMLYNWNEETTYNTLTIEKVEEAIEEADVKNYQHPTEENGLKKWLCEPINVTEEEMELINDFLNE